MKFNILRICSIAVAVIGLIILIKSVNIGDDFAFRYLKEMGGSMNADDLRLIKNNYIETYRWLGGILLLVGGFGSFRK